MSTGKIDFDTVANWPDWPQGWVFTDVSGVAVDSKDRVYAFTRGPRPIAVFDRDGGFLRSWGEGLFTRPHGIHISRDDAVYCTDVGDHTVRKFTTNGDLLLVLGTPGEPSDTGSQGRDFRTIRRPAGPFNAPTSVAVSSHGHIFVADGYGNARVHRFSPDGRLELSWGEPGDGPGQFRLPHGIAVSDDNRVYVGDRENNRIQVFTFDGQFITQWRNVFRPNDICLDKAQQHVYVAELGHRIGTAMGLPEPGADSPPSAVSVYDLDGRLLVRWGEQDYSSPNSVYAAHGLALDSRGDIYVAEVCWAVSQGVPPSGVRPLRKLLIRSA